MRNRWVNAHNRVASNRHVAIEVQMMKMDRAGRVMGKGRSHGRRAWDDFRRAIFNKNCRYLACLIEECLATFADPDGAGEGRSASGRRREVGLALGTPLE